MTNNFTDFKGKEVNFIELNSTKIIFITFSWNTCFDCYKNLASFVDHLDKNFNCFVICPFQNSTLKRRMFREKLTKFISSEIIFAKSNTITIPFTQLSFNFEAETSPTLFLIDKSRKDFLKLTYSELFYNSAELKDEAKNAIYSFLKIKPKNYQNIK